MYCNGCRFIALIAVLMLLMQLAACGGSNDSPAETGSFPVVVFSDIHFNPFYDPSVFTQLNASDADNWPGIFQTSSIKGPPTWGADTSYPLLVIALASIRQNLSKCPLVIFTGDLLGHDFPKQFFNLYKPGDTSEPNSEDIAAMKAFADKTVTFLMQQIRSSVGSIPVMFALGNTDSYMGLGAENDFLSNTAELFYSQFISGTVDHDTFVTTYTTDGYYAAEPPGMDLVIIALNTYKFSPDFKGLYAAGIADQLAWFDSALDSAMRKGKKVWLLMHVPPGADKYSTAQAVDASGQISTATMLWGPNYQESFLNILSKYDGLIALTLVAHTHMDEYRIMSSGNAAVTTPGIAPYFGNNPAYKIFNVSSNTLRATDYRSLNYNLATTPDQFSSYYTFSTQYYLQGALGDSLALLYPWLVAGNTRQARYRDSYFSGHNYINPPGNTFNPITDLTWPVYWCAINHMDEKSLKECVNNY